MLTLIKKNVEIKGYVTKSLYRCSCGNEKVINDDNVKYGKTKSCGCLHKKRTSEATTKHGMSGTRVHRIWLGMVGRCTVKSNSSYKRYGGRGIKVCDRWLNFENFLSDMGEPSEDQTIDRINGELGYYPENCRWATYQEQAMNRTRVSKNKSGVRGVYYSSSRGTYIVRITKDGIDHRIKETRSLIDAVKSRIEAEIEYGFIDKCNIEEVASSVIESLGK